METRSEERPTAQVELTLAGWSPRQRDQPDPTPPPPARLPRITRLMALAIKLQDIVDRGEVRDYADIARLGYVTRARITQIMNLLLLAPDVQESILDLNLNGESPFSETHIRSIAALELWADQRAAIKGLDRLSGPARM